MEEESDGVYAYTLLAYSSVHAIRGFGFRDRALNKNGTGFGRIIF